MSNSIELSTPHILTPDGKTIGTGFLVAKNLVVTCMRVIALAGLDINGRISKPVTGQKTFFAPGFIGKQSQNKLYSFGHATTIGQIGLGSLGTFATQKKGGN